MGSKMKCPICGNEMTVKMDEKGVPTDMYACLKGCHCLLPKSVVEEKKAIFPIIVLGTKDVGKSCYIGALLKLSYLLQKRHLPDYIQFFCSRQM